MLILKSVLGKYACKHVFVMFTLFCFKVHARVACVLMVSCFAAGLNFEINIWTLKYMLHINLLHMCTYVTCKYIETRAKIYSLWVYNFYCHMWSLIKVFIVVTMALLSNFTLCRKLPMVIGSLPWLCNKLSWLLCHIWSLHVLIGYFRWLYMVSMY